MHSISLREVEKLKGFQRKWLLLAAAVLLGLPSATLGLTFTVNTVGDAGDVNIGNSICDADAATSGQQCTLRAAIQEANAHAGGDVIDFSITHYIGGQNDIPTITLTSPLPDLSTDLEISGPGADKLAVSRVPSTGENHIFKVTTLGLVTLSGMTIRDGGKTTIADAGETTRDAPNREIIRHGGGIWNFATGTVNVSNCSVLDNRATYGGGGIANTDTGTVNLTNCTVSGNSVALGGGGIYNDAGTVNVTNCTINGNVTSRSSDGGQGGGFAVYGGHVNVTNSTISGNQAEGDEDGSGGGFHIENGTVEITNCTLSGNSAGTKGGGIHIADGTAILTNCTLSGNSAATDGGGIYNFNATVRLRHCTISGNSANFGGGYLAVGVLGGNPENLISNSLIALNTATSSGPDVAGPAFTTEGFNLIGKNDEAAESFPAGNPNANNDIVGTSASPIDPKLDPNGLQNNGVPLKTIALLTGSPAIDKGVRNDLTTDQRGHPRPFDYGNIPPAAGGDNSDIGAFEANDLQLGPSLTVTTVNDHDDGGCQLADCTLREAISAANNLFGDNVILFAPAAKGTVQLTGALPSLRTNIAINGSGADLLTVRRNSSSDYRIFTIGDAIDPGPIVHLSGLTITNGRITSGGFPFGTGAGVANLRGTLTLTDCTVSNNHSGGTFGLGGGVFSYEGALIVQRCTFSGNSATNGGGSIVNAGTSTTGSLTIENSLLKDNSTAGRGGGVFNLASNGDADLSLTNCTLSGNSAASGGAIENYADAGSAAKAMLTNCTLSGNSASNGGGIHNFNDSANPGAPSVTLRNNILKAGTSGANLFNEGGGPITSDGHNLSSDNGGSFLIASGDRIDTDPILGALDNNGGPTQTHALSATSLAINAGDDNFAPVTDQRGYLRAGVSDIGAFEFAGASPAPTPTPTIAPTPTPTPSTLGNIATRLPVGTGDNVLIGGFIITGTQPKKVIVRAIGPSLPLAGALADPTLELYDSNGLLASNDNWRSDQEAQIIATTIPPTNDFESAIVATLPANNAGYTAVLRGVGGSTGIGVVETYDLDGSVDSKLANISTRGLVQTGDNVLIAGTIVLGQSPRKVVVRAIGPSLPFAGVLADPTLELRDANGGLLRSNDNWRSGGQEAEIIATTIPPTNDFESALVETLPGNGASYTAIVRGINNTTGIAVVEIYALN